MCGIAGCAGNLDDKDTKVFSQLLYLQAFRGMDSTGIAVSGFPVADGKSEVTVIKQTLPAPDFLDMDRVKTTIAGGKQLLLGHARSRTVGEVNKRNAQPFEFDHVVGVHNGTLSGGAKNRLEGPAIFYPTDSEAMYSRLNNEGLDGVAKLTDKDDAMALVWVNKDDHTLNFYRNSKRPLWYAFNEKGDKVYWASESGMLYLVLNRNEVAFKKVRSLPENLHWSVKLPTKPGALLPIPVTRFCHQQKTASTAPATAAQSARVFAVGSVDTGAGRASNPALVDTKGRPLQIIGPKIPNKDIPSMGSLGSNVVLFKGRNISDAAFRLNRIIQRPEKDGGPYYKSESGRHYDEKKFDDKMCDGCCICGVNPLWGEGIRFLPDESFVCSSCMAEAKEKVGDPNASSTTLCLLNHLK